MSTPALRLTGVSREHGSGDTVVHALRGVSLEVWPGELVAVMGPSGSGKSTLLNLAGALDRPTSGEIAIDGLVLGGLKAEQLAQLRRRRVGVVFQSYNLIPALTAAENIALPLELDGQPVLAARQQARAVLKDLGLSGLADRFPDQLSGGQQQRVAIARALMQESRVLLADEPVASLDPDAARMVLALMRRLAKSRGLAVLCTLHQPHLAAEFADRTLHMRSGRIVSGGDQA